MDGTKSETQVEGGFDECEHGEYDASHQKFNFKLDEVTSIASQTSDPATESHHTGVGLDSEDEDYEETSQTTDNLVHPSETLNPSSQNHLSPDDPTPNTSDRPCLRVHFRSRVRITAGMGRRRCLPERDGLSSSASSISGSPSSSISAPLRIRHTGDNSGWGPLGRRVSLLASQPAIPQTRVAHTGTGNINGRRKHSRRSSLDHDSVDERTRLVSSRNHHSYTASRFEADEAERARQWREQVIEEHFGKWPRRLLNRHWWWWQLEPIVCCFCICGDADIGD